MKMAKASAQDIQAALDLVQFLQNIDRFDLMSEDGKFERRFDPDKPKDLQEFHSRIMAIWDRAPGGISRVVWGFHTIDHNNILDPKSDHLALHPRLLAAAAAPAVSAQDGQGSPAKT